MNDSPLQPLKKRGSFSPVLLELTIIILFFALSTSIVVQLIAAASSISSESAYHARALLAMETVAEQTDVLEGFSDALKRYLLQTECDIILDPRNASGLDASIAQWPQWWKNGDANAFAAEYLKGYLAPGYEELCAEYHARLITERNARMTRRLAALLEGGGSYFVTVGLLHLVLPEDSVVAGLRELGYTVEQIDD